MNPYLKDENGHRVKYERGVWYAYADPQGESYRGKGPTKEAAIEDSKQQNEKYL